MQEDDFALLMQAKHRLEDLENRMPLAARVGALHNHATRMIYRFRDKLELTDEQFGQLVAPQGGGTPKTDPDKK